MSGHASDSGARDANFEDEADDANSARNPQRRPSPARVESPIPDGDPSSGRRDTPNRERSDSAARSEQTRQLPKRVFVNNFPFTTLEEELMDLFSKSGKIRSMKLLTTPQGRLRGIAFIQFDTVEASEDAIARFNNYNFNGRNLNVEWTTQDDDGVDRFRHKIWLECAPRPSVLAALPNLSDELKTQAMTVGMEVCRTEYEPPDIAPTWLDEQELMATFIQLFPADG